MLSTHTNRPEASPLPSEPEVGGRGDQNRRQLVVVLRALHRLLEDHAPQWYTCEHHRIGELGLKQEGHRQAEALLRLYDLLEQYAPAWYPSELHHGAEMAAQHLKKVRGHPRN